jgi:transcriptional regulator with XRE-family HTH domain
VADNRYARARELAGLSVGQAARVLGVSTAELAAVEQAQVPIFVLTNERLSEIYGCSVAWLTGVAPRVDYAALDRIPGGRDLDFHDRDMLAELLATLPRRSA